MLIALCARSETKVKEDIRQIKRVLQAQLTLGIMVDWPSNLHLTPWAEVYPKNEQ